MTTTKTTKEQLDTVKQNVDSVKKTIEEIQQKSTQYTPEIKKQLDDLIPLLEPVQQAADTLIPKNDTLAPVRSFIRRLLSREVIIAVVTIITIANGNLATEEAIGVAIAGTGLILGRSAVKLRQQNNLN